MRLATVFTFIIGLIMTACNAKASNPGVEVVPPKEFQTRVNQDTTAYLLDVRRPDEYEAGHLKGAYLLNWLDTDSFKQGAESLDRSKTIYVYCRSGRRSNEAARYLAEKGYKVVDMAGGILAWEESKLPTVKGTNNDKINGY